jgi:hypothetical protein
MLDSVGKRETLSEMLSGPFGLDSHGVPVAFIFGIGFVRR